ncbi:MAG TPA: nicotinic acid mononucleotide adenylyltransferase [Gammaproteobacteria bacterium]|nr:nicotinic acid mononucleotide adenylyltransferase [Gammaproteobacteria bacterium]
MIGIFGGTFDPIHYGHLRPAEEARDQLALKEVRFVPAGQPPLRTRPVASAAQRLAMVELAIRGIDRFRVDARELLHEGPSYTVLTLESLRRELPTTPLCLLIGMDQFLGFERWHRWPEIPDLAHLVVLRRPGAVLGTLPGWAQPRFTEAIADLRASSAGRLAFLPVHPQDISATRIREALARGDSVSRLLPETVLAYIHTNHLYGQSDRGA